MKNLGLIVQMLRKDADRAEQSGSRGPCYPQMARAIADAFTDIDLHETQLEKVSFVRDYFGPRRDIYEQELEYVKARLAKIRSEKPEFSWVI